MRKKQDESNINLEVREAKGILGSIVLCFKKENQLLVLISGKMGSGKSYVSLRLLELFYKSLDQYGKTFDFEIESKIEVEDWMICRSAEQFAEAMLRAKPGTLLILEEASALYSSRRSASTENVSVLAILETARKRKIGLIFNFPLSKGLDIGIKRLASHTIEMKKIYKGKGFSVGEVRRIDYNQKIDKIYFKAPKVRENGKIRKVYKSWFAYPENTDLIKRYEDLKDDFIENHFLKQIRKLKNKRLKEEAESFIEKTPLQNGMEKKRKLIKELRDEGLTMQQIGDKVGLSKQRIWKILKEKDGEK